MLGPQTEQKKPLQESCFETDFDEETFKNASKLPTPNLSY